MAGETLCACGCGETAPVATKNNTARGYVKGEAFRFVQGHNRPMLGRTQTAETREMIRESRLGDKHPLWKGDDASYASLHRWLGENHPKTGTCESCAEAQSTEYAFLHHPEPHTRDRDDYAELCRDCHMEFDAVVREAVAA